ncbi:MAG: hypothetical protein L0323_05250 [Planctomycetes bacterium]|nr:hypothetical protein [Planctomycetota bacterium]
MPSFLDPEELELALDLEADDEVAGPRARGEDEELLDSIEPDLVDLLERAVVVDDAGLPLPSRERPASPEQVRLPPPTKEGVSRIGRFRGASEPRKGM